MKRVADRRRDLGLDDMVASTESVARADFRGYLAVARHEVNVAVFASSGNATAGGVPNDPLDKTRKRCS